MTVMRSIGSGSAGRVLAAMSRATGVAVAVFFAVHLPLAVQGGHIPAFGLIERAGFALMVAYLITVAVTLRGQR